MVINFLVDQTYAEQMLTQEVLKIRITIRVPSIQEYHETELGRAMIEKMENNPKSF